MNLPAGGVTLVAIVWFVKAAPAAGLDLIVAKEVAETGAPKSTLRRVASLDWLGAVLMLGLTTCLILALQQGGISKPWSDASIVSRCPPSLSLPTSEHRPPSLPPHLDTAPPPSLPSHLRTPG